MQATNLRIRLFLISVWGMVASANVSASESLDEIVQSWTDTYIPAVMTLLFVLTLPLAANLYRNAFRLIYYRVMEGDDSRVKMGRIAAHFIAGTMLWATPLTINAVNTSVYGVPDLVTGNPYAEAALNRDILASATNASQNPYMQLLPPRMAVFVVMMISLLGLAAFIKGWHMMSDMDWDIRNTAANRGGPSLKTAFVLIVFGGLGMACHTFIW